MLLVCRRDAPFLATCVPGRMGEAWSEKEGKYIMDEDLRACFGARLCKERFRCFPENDKYCQVFAVLPASGRPAPPARPGKTKKKVHWGQVRRSPGHTGLQSLP